MHAGAEDFIKEKAAMTIPTYLPYYVLIGAIAIIATILFGLRNALAKAAWPKYDRALAFRFSAVILIGWVSARPRARISGRLPGSA